MVEGEVRLTGEVAIRAGDRIFVPVRAGSAQVQLTLAALVLGRDRGVSNAELADLLWPDDGGGHAGAAAHLRNLVSWVRKPLNAAFGAAALPVRPPGGVHRVALPPGVTVDVEEAARLLAAARTRLVAGDHEGARSAARAAAGRAGGRLLPAVDTPWAADRRHELDQVWFGALEVVGDAALARADLAEALDAATRMVGRDPLRVGAHARLIRAYAAGDDRASAEWALHGFAWRLGQAGHHQPLPPELAELFDELFPPAPVPPAVGAADLPAPPEAGPLPFVGRTAALAALDEAWDRAGAGAPHLVLASGEAGIGLTRLGQEATRRVRGRGGRALRGGCDRDGTVAHQPLVEALGAVLSTAPAGELPGADRHGLAPLLSPPPPTPRAPAGPGVPEVPTGTAAGGPTGAASPAGPATAASERPEVPAHPAASAAADGPARPDAPSAPGVPVARLATAVAGAADGPARPDASSAPGVPVARLATAVAGALTALAADQPTLVVLDDLQWAAPETLVVLRRAVREVAPGAPLLVLGLARDDGSHPAGPLAALGPLAAEGLMTRLRLGGLTEAESRELAAAAGCPAPRARRLSAESAGNPFLLGQLLAAGDPGEAGPRDDPDRHRLPDPLHGWVADRLAEAGGDAAALVRAGALDGSTFDVDVATDAAGLSPAAGLDAADAAVGAHLLAEDAGGPPGRLRFVHPVVRQAVVQRLGPARRRTLHRRTAAALAERGRDSPDRLVAAATHALAGAHPGPDAEAVHRALAAARQAMDNGDPAAAARLLGDARPHLPPGDDGRAAELLVALGRATLEVATLEGTAGIDDLAGGTGGGSDGADGTGGGTGSPGGHGGHGDGRGTSGAGGAAGLLAEGATYARGARRADLAATAALTLADTALAGRSRHSPREEPTPAHTGLAVPSRGTPLERRALALADLVLEMPGGGGATFARLRVRRAELSGAPLATPPAADLADVARALAELAGADALDERDAVARDLAALAQAAADAGAELTATHARAAVAAYRSDPATVRRLLSPEGGHRTGDPARDRAWRRWLTAESARDGWFQDLDDLDVAEADVDPDLRLVTAWMRGRLPAGAAAAAGPPGAPAGAGHPVAAALAALVAVDAGEAERAGALLLGIGLGVDPLPPGDGWLPGAATAALAAVQLGDAALARRAHGLLSPYAGLSCGRGFQSFVGTADHHLGCLELVMGEYAAATRHLEQALATHARLDARPWTALTRHALALALDAGGNYRDRDVARDHREEAARLAADCGLRPLDEMFGAPGGDRAANA